jgi:hypothetical protein
MIAMAQEDAMNEPQPIPPRQRLRDLLTIPESQRTDAQWDEINELEIKLASSNRQDSPQQQNSQQNSRRHAPGQGHPRPGGNPQGKKPFRKFHKRRPPNGGAL